MVPTNGSRSDSGNDTIRYPAVHDTAALTYLVNLASLELHVPQWDSMPTASHAIPTGW